jgi:hypothetical protein
VSPRPLRAARPAALALAGLLAVSVAPALAGPTLTITGWGRIAADISGPRLVYADSATVNTERFAYWRTDTFRVGLTRTGFGGRPTRAAVLRTSAGPMDRAWITGNGLGGFVVVAAGRGYPAPSVWCCDPTGTEAVIESDGRSTAPRVVASAQQGPRSVATVLGRRGSYRVLLVDPIEPTTSRVFYGFPGRPAEGLIGMARGLVAWADQPVYGSRPVVRVGVPGPRAVTGIRSIPQPGRVLRVWAVTGLVVVATRVGGRVEIARHPLPSGRRTVVWRGAALPPVVAVGGGTVAVAQGRDVLAARAGALRRVRTGAGPVSGLAVDRSRVVSFERVRIADKKTRKLLPRTVARVVRISA